MGPDFLVLFPRVIRPYDNIPPSPILGIRAATTLNPKPGKYAFESEAGAAGYQAVWGVAHALHTPLMSAPCPRVTGKHGVL